MRRKTLGTVLATAWMLFSADGPIAAPPDEKGAGPDAIKPVVQTLRARRDPFQPLITERKEPPKPAPQPPRVRPAGLGGMLVAETTVMGIASGGKSRVAILQGREKVTYFGRVGDKLFDGVIAVIDPDKVVFTEQSAGPDGKELQKSITKKLYAEIEPMANLGMPHGN